MRKIYILCLLVLLGVSVNAQQETPTEGAAKTDVAEGQVTQEDQEKMTRMMELMGQKIEMDVDMTLFISVSTNAYVSENPKAVIMAMMVPDSYENSKKKMDSDSVERFTITEKGETEINGLKTLYMEGISEAEGSVLDNTMYCIEVDANTCLMFVGMVDQKADPKFAEAITKALNSVIKKK